jgi:hypothetical protein
MVKNSCLVTRDHFRNHAKPIKVHIGENQLLALPKEFSTGSIGWYLNGKQQIDMGGTLVTVQIGLSLTIVGSKELPHG